MHIWIFSICNFWETILFVASHFYAVQPATGDVHETKFFIRKLVFFLQPLILELKDSWSSGVTYNFFMKKKIMIRAVLLWTISDFLAYRMLSGWTTHERLSCPYCLGMKDAFRLKNGRKTYWF